MRVLIFLIGLLLCASYAADKTPEFVTEDVPSWVELVKKKSFLTLQTKKVQVASIINLLILK
jgi:hypothetical protein